MKSMTGFECILRSIAIALSMGPLKVVGRLCTMIPKIYFMSMERSMAPRLDMALRMKLMMSAASPGLVAPGKHWGEQ
jgi:hypothetical protein